MNHRLRLSLIALVVFAWAGLVLSRVVILQVHRSGELRLRAAQQHNMRIKLDPKRGTIRDSRGRILAINVDAPSLYCVPEEVDDPAAAARALSGPLGRPAEELERALRKESNFVWLRRKATPEVKAAVEALRLAGIHSVMESKRVYPAGRLAGHVLGFADIDNVGRGGVEYEYNRFLQGKPGLMIGIRGAKSGYIFSRGKILENPVGGSDVRLTIDWKIQHIVEAKLKDAVELHGCRSGTVVALDPHSGAILALANYPDFDPNRPGAFPAEVRRNRAVVDAYEPGSTFKLVTAAAALEAGVTSLDEVIDCGNGSIQIGSRVIHDHKVFDRLPFRAVIEKSSNIGAIRVALRLGAERLWRKAAAFGFGARSGVDLPAENPGVLRPVSRWSEDSIGSIAIGQEVSANPVQILLPLAAVANGGYWVRPYVVEAVVGAEGRELYHARPGKRGVLLPEALAKLREATRGVVLRGSGVQAAIRGLAISGKTGTAEVSVPGDGYLKGAYVSSFVGFFPAGEPRVAMLCLLDRPLGAYHGSEVAAPLFSAIVMELAKLLELDSDLEEVVPEHRELELAAVDGGRESIGPKPVKRTLEQPRESLVMPDLRGLSLREAVTRLARLGVVPRIVGGGRVSAQTPAPGRPIGGDTVLRCGTEFASDLER